MFSATQESSWGEATIRDARTTSLASARSPRRAVPRASEDQVGAWKKKSSGTSSQFTRWAQWLWHLPNEGGKEVVLGSVPWRAYAEESDSLG